MTRTILLLAVLCAQAAVAGAPAAKTYTEEDFIKKVAEELRHQVDALKKKSVSDLTKELVAKDESLRLKELELEKRKDQLDVLGVELEKKIRAHNEELQSLLVCVKQVDEEHVARIEQQVEVVSNMQPAKAAQLLSVQEAEIAVQILQKLDAKKASKIFNLMDKEVSARLQKQYMSMKR